jgi:uncharacterized protein (TIGR02246 family)
VAERKGGEKKGGMERKEMVILQTRKGKEEARMGKVKKGLLFITVLGSMFFGVVPGIWAGPLEEAAQIREQWIKAFHEGNAEALSALYVRDGVHIPWTGPFRIEGREGIRAYYMRTFHPYPMRRMVMRDISNRVHGDTVVTHMNWSLFYEDGKGTAKVLYGRTIWVSGVVEGRRVIIDSSSSLLPTTVP